MDYPIIRVLICDRLDVPFPKRDRNGYVRDVYHLIADYAPRRAYDRTFNCRLNDESAAGQWGQTSLF